jgi:hypothetical protein
MIYILFFVLALLFATEATTALARVAGYKVGRPESGLMLQSSLGLISRLLIFMFMPVLGWMADSGNIYDHYYELLAGYLLTPFFLFIVYVMRKTVERFFMSTVLGVAEYGSLFKRVVDTQLINRSLYVTRMPKKFNGFIFFYFLAYIPYYLAWPLIIVLIDMYPENRGVLLGLTGVFNGVNTLLLTLVVDPMLIRYGRKYNVICRMYPLLVKIRLYVSVLILVIMLGFYGISNAL